MRLYLGIEAIYLRKSEAMCTAHWPSGQCEQRGDRRDLRERKGQRSVVFLHKAGFSTTQSPSPAVVPRRPGKSQKRPEFLARWIAQTGHQVAGVIDGSSPCEPAAVELLVPAAQSLMCNPLCAGASAAFSRRSSNNPSLRRRPPVRASSLPWPCDGMSGLATTTTTTTLRPRKRHFAPWARAPTLPSHQRTISCPLT